MALRPKVYQFLVGVFASMGSILFGYDLGVIASVIAASNFKEYFHNPSTTHTGIVVSFFTGGAFCGAGLAGPSGDRLGRRMTIVIGSVVYLLGGSLQTGAANLDMMWAGRWLAGVGVGFLVMIIPLYQSEIAHPSIRGMITSLQQFMLGLGAFIAGWISYGTYVGLSNQAQWRLPLAIQMLPAISSVYPGLKPAVLTSSPWLIDHGRPDEGLKTLARLHSNGDEDDPWVRAEFDQIQESLTDEHENEAKSYLDLFTNRSSFRRVLIACALQASIQMTGVSAIQYYSVDIYGSIGIRGDEALKYQAINNIIALSSPARKACTGADEHQVCFLVACVLIAKFPVGNSNNKAASWGFISMTWLYNFSFSATCGPISWVIPAEIFDTRTRSKGVSIATMVSFAFNTLIGQVTGTAMQNIGYRYYFVFIICNFTNALFFYLFLPETKDLPLEEMNYLFTNAPWIVAMHDKALYQANYAGDLERRAAEIQDKHLAVDTHEKQV
ncbi:unnamed protein product [Diplocarpon coronariae]|nr:hypothetical protein JHW43_000939 [Diplocarpon mali]